MPQGVSITGRTVLVAGRSPGSIPILLSLTNDGWMIASAHLQVSGNPVTAANPVPVLGVVGLVTDAYDYINCGYDVAGNLTGVVYRTGGATGPTVATLALTYDGSGNLDTITKT